MVYISTLSLRMLKSALWKSIFATFVFIVFYLFYSIEIIRINVEDIAFDTVNKFSVHKHPVGINSPNVLLFAYDDLYMKEQNLFDEDNRSNYGYLFPRDHIAKFIEGLDELVSDLDTGKHPKALFIDYDMGFTAMPYGKVLSKEDQKLIEVLKNRRNYKILLPKTEKSNFIEQSSDVGIQKLIKEGKLQFVSVPLLRSNDDTVRRYQSFQSFGELHPSKDYNSVNVMMWQIMRDKPGVDIFMKDDIVANRIFLKAYNLGNVDEEGCASQTSHWKQLKKYSAHCSLFEIPYEDYDGSVIFLGGTHSQNYDKFSTLSVLGSKKYAGIDIHANALMTMLHLDGALKRFSMFWSIIIVFVGFFILDILLSGVFHKFNVEHEKLSFILLLLFSSILFFSLSVYFLREHHLWFNWFVPVILFQVLEILFLVRKKSTKSILKIIKILGR